MISRRILAVSGASFGLASPTNATFPLRLGRHLIDWDGCRVDRDERVDTVPRMMNAAGCCPQCHVGGAMRRTIPRSETWSAKNQAVAHVVI